MKYISKDKLNYSAPSSSSQIEYTSAEFGMHATESELHNAESSGVASLHSVQHNSQDLTTVLSGRKITVSFYFASRQQVNLHHLLTSIIHKNKLIYLYTLRKWEIFFKYFCSHTNRYIAAKVSFYILISYKKAQIGESQEEALSTLFVFICSAICVLCFCIVLFALNLSPMSPKTVTD